MCLFSISISHAAQKQGEAKQSDNSLSRKNVLNFFYFLTN